MKVSELIEALQLCDPNLEVYGVSDHGQTPEKVSAPSVIYADSLDYDLYEGYASNAVDAEEEGYRVKAVLL